MDEGAARARSRPTKTRIPRRPVYPSLFLLRWVDVATKRRKRKEKRKKGMATRRERRWDLPAPVPRLPSFDPMIRISRRVVRVYTRTRLFRSVHVRVCACRGITTNADLYIYILNVRIKKRGLVARYTLVRMRDVVSGCLQDT